MKSITIKLAILIGIGLYQTACLVDQKIFCFEDSDDCIEQKSTISSTASQNLEEATNQPSRVRIDMHEDSSENNTPILSSIPQPLTIVSISSILDAARNIANSMERTRLIPEIITIDNYILNDAEYLSTAVETLRSIISQSPIQNINVSLYLGSNLPPSDRYPYADLLSSINELRYESPLTQTEYNMLLTQIESDISSGQFSGTLTTSNGADIRYPEYLYFVSSLLRFYEFFDYLPQSHSLHIISPKGLVPWDMPIGFETYASVLGWPGFDFENNRYYTWNAHHYSVFKQAMDVVGSETIPQIAGENLYNWAKQIAYNQPGYFRYSSHPLGGSFASTSEWIKYRRGTSGTPRRTIRGLMRSLNIPISSSAEAIYLEEYTNVLVEDGPVLSQGAQWYNAEIHESYGTNPAENSFNYEINSDITSLDYRTPPTEPFIDPNPNDLFISDINSLTMASSGVTALNMAKAIFINPRDIGEYGASYIVTKAQAGGINTIVLTVKTLRGNSYFTHGINFVFDALTPLLSEANLAGINVYAAFSTLADYAMAESNNSWRQTSGTNSDFSAGDISPCIQDYRLQLNEQLISLLSSYRLHGVVLSGLSFVTESMGQNSECQMYSSTSANWKEELITSYTAELITTIQTHCSSCVVKTLTQPAGNQFRLSDFSNVNWTTQLGGQNLINLSSLGNGITIPYVGNIWLRALGYHFPNVVAYLYQETGITPSFSFYLTDEWEYPAEFFNGLIDEVSQSGIDFTILHSGNSLDGEYGPAFTRSQYQKLSEMNL